MESRRTHVTKAGDQRRFLAVEGVDRAAAVAIPIIAAGDVTGAVILMMPENGAIPGDTELKLIQVAASFLGKQMEE